MLSSLRDIISSDRASKISQTDQCVVTICNMPSPVLQSFHLIVQNNAKRSADRRASGSSRSTDLKKSDVITSFEDGIDRLSYQREQWNPLGHLVNSDLARNPRRCCWSQRECVLMPVLPHGKISEI